MKKAMVLITALSLLTVSLLTGCGTTNDRDGNTQRPPEATNTQPPAATQQPDQNGILPDDMMPDREDGEVDDNDGVITEHEKPDTGSNGTMTAN